MRPIDADELLKHQRKMHGFGISPEEDYWTFAVHATDIKDAPTIDPESLRSQGEWIRYHEADLGWDEWGSICSNCKWEVEDDIVIPTNYCPNCGAKMKGAGD